MVDAAARIWRLRNEEIIASNDGRIVQSCGTCREAGTTGGGAGGGGGGGVGEFVAGMSHKAQNYQGEGSHLWTLILKVVL